MANINPDPHRAGYAFIPVHRMTAVFRTDAEARAAVADVRALGIAGRHIDVFIGPGGAAALDLDGERHGRMARLLRWLEKQTVQLAAETSRQARAMLDDGGIGVAIAVPGRNAIKGAVAAALRRHSGAAVRYWGRWTIESFDRVRTRSRAAATAVTGAEPAPADNVTASRTSPTAPFPWLMGMLAITALWLFGLLTMAAAFAAQESVAPMLLLLPWSVVAALLMATVVARGGWSGERDLGQTAVAPATSEAANPDLDAALADSFPASDPPAFNPGIARIRPAPHT